MNWDALGISPRVAGDAHACTLTPRCTHCPWLYRGSAAHPDGWGDSVPWPNALCHPPPGLAPTGLWGPRRCRAPHAPLPHRRLLAGWQFWGGGDLAQLLLAGDVTGCYSPYSPPRHAVWECFSWELLNNLHPLRRSFWAVFVKVNLQLAASGDSNTIAASSLNDAHGDCSGTDPPSAGTDPCSRPRAASQSWAGAGDLLPIPVRPPSPSTPRLQFLGSRQGESHQLMGAAGSRFP